MSNRTMPSNQTLAVNFTLDIGDGPLAQSILALSSSSVLSTCFSYLAYCVISLVSHFCPPDCPEC
jgi:hypothetical protein